MRRAAVLAISAVLLGLGWAADAMAWGLAYDVPTAFTFKSKVLNVADKGAGDITADSTSAKPDGYKIALIFPFNMGIAIEDYKFKTKATFTDVTNTPPTVPVVFNPHFTFTDVFVDVAVGWFNLGGGLGRGKVTAGFEDDLANPLGIRVGDTTATQGFLTIGFRVFKSFDVHLAYHEVATGSAKVRDAVTGQIRNVINLSGSMTSLGIRADW